MRVPSEEDLDEVMAEDMEAEDKVGRGFNSQELDTGRSATKVGMNVQVYMKTHGRPLNVGVPDLNEVAIPEAVMHDQMVDDSRVILPYMGLVTEGSPMGVEVDCYQSREQVVMRQPQPLMLFGSEILT
ncbi:hypothetical protein ACFX15_022234 [Malus domestica]